MDEDIYKDFRLPDGRTPTRFDKGNAAFYKKKRGNGEVRYLFSMIKHIRNNRPLLSKQERSLIAKNNAANIKKKTPDFFAKIGTIGGRNGRKNIEIEKS